MLGYYFIRYKIDYFKFLQFYSWLQPYFSNNIDIFVLIIRCNIYICVCVHMCVCVCILNRRIIM